jgi:hypothetical protein
LPRRRVIAATSALLLALGLAAVGRGGVAMYPKPTVYRVLPERSCHRELVKGPQPKRMLVPAAPGLTATAITSHRIELRWTLAPVPLTCRSRFLLLSIAKYGSSRYTPITYRVPTNGRLTGKRTLVYGSFAPPPDVALSSGLLANGLRSRTVAVLIRR